MKTANLEQLLVALLETGQAIAGEPDDPMHETLATAGDIDSVAPDGNGGIALTTADGRTFRISIAESR